MKKVHFLTLLPLSRSRDSLSPRTPSLSYIFIVDMFSISRLIIKVLTQLTGSSTTRTNSDLSQIIIPNNKRWGRGSPPVVSSCICKSLRFVYNKTGNKDKCRDVYDYTSEEGTMSVKPQVCQEELGLLWSSESWILIESFSSV